MMKRWFACAAWGAVALVPVVAGAVPTTVIKQTAAPVGIQSCSAVLHSGGSPAGYSSGASGASGPVAITYGEHIAYYGSPPSGPYSKSEPAGPGPLTAGTQIYATAQSVNRSAKSVAGVVYEFNVMQGPGNMPSTVFYGGQTGSFANDIVISPPGLGTSSPWSTTLANSRVRSIGCFVAYVRFSDGTEWTSPLAIVQT